MNEAVESVGVRDGGTLRGRCAHAHPHCQDKLGMKGTSGTPVPASVPWDFTVRLGDVILDGSRGRIYPSDLSNYPLKTDTHLRSPSREAFITPRVLCETLSIGRQHKCKGKDNNKNCSK